MPLLPPATNAFMRVGIRECAGGAKGEISTDVEIRQEAESGHSLAKHRRPTEEASVLILLLIADLQGKIVDTVTWGDEKVVVTVDETKKGTGIYGYHFVKNKQLWRTQDGVFDCELDMTARYLKGTLAITDLDNDGVKESWFAYEVACRGDVSPTTIKNPAIVSPAQRCSRTQNGLVNSPARRVDIPLTS